MALINYMETYFKHTTPNITLISEEKFKINVHKEMFYQTQLMRSMIRSTDSDYCCSKFSVICSIPREELELIVQFLYSGEVFCRNQKEANVLSENLTGLFGFPQICSSLIVEPKLETTLNSLSPKSIQKKPRKQSLTSAFIGDEFAVDLVTIKTETKPI